MFYQLQLKLENTEGTIKNGQFRETGNIGYTRRRKTKQTNVREYRKGKIKNDQSRETGNIGYTRRRKQNKNTTQYMLDTIVCKQTQIT